MIVTVTSLKHDSPSLMMMIIMIIIMMIIVTRRPGGESSYRLETVNRNARDWHNGVLVTGMVAAGRVHRSTSLRLASEEQTGGCWKRQRLRARGRGGRGRGGRRPRHPQDRRNSPGCPRPAAAVGRLPHRGRAGWADISNLNQGLFFDNYLQLFVLFEITEIFLLIKYLPIV